MDICINPFARGIVTRRKKGSNEVDEFEVPYVCKFYNMSMGSCDAASAHRAPFEIDIKSKRHNNRTAFALFEFWALINPAITLAEIYGDRNLKHLTHRRALLHKWAGEYKSYCRDHGMLGRKARPITMEAR